MKILVIPMAGALLGLGLLAGPAHAGTPIALTAPLLLVDDDDDDDDGRRRWIRQRHVEWHHYQVTPRNYYRGHDDDDDDRGRYRGWRFRRHGDDDGDD
ncbi:hypothetical protein G3545_00600 [Starkeya sp. ORNL1]|uniref:hypothetical protein n=1 Tax=Starkeya sp. ORNL1 TaxID=2709380 RepID=UPI0014628859|nr:hypothetical protein [Starkeya sp. ORNL1]QJP12288.1 hypothetical protein G3545_00600 [Starkeya sp. ORNL1]